MIVYVNRRKVKVCENCGNEHFRMESAKYCLSCRKELTKKQKRSNLKDWRVKNGRPERNKKN